MKISIVTVCLNPGEDLRKTMSSIQNQTGCDIESIVIDGGSKDGSIEYIKSLGKSVQWISEPDNGIYDAMNKGLRMAKGNAILFLNAGDYFEGDVLRHVSSCPGLIPVVTKKAGLYSTLLKPKSFKSGLPYCHQGIVFENKGLQYDLKYQIAADYDFYLRNGYRDLEFLMSDKLGHVVYDNFGVSAQKSQQRDSEIAKIIEKNFGRLPKLIFSIWAVAKRLIKSVLLRLFKAKRQ